MIVHARRAVARVLEAAAGLPGLSLDPIRALRLPERTAVIGVGGATLGGSFRTPVAIAAAAALAEAGASVAFVAHGYGARVEHATVVARDSDVLAVGDEALIAARALSVPVIVAPDRGAALALAARHARVVVVDRLLQTRPTRLTRSLLALDAAAPWGSGRGVPFGDRLASPAALERACDERVLVTAADERYSLSGPIAGRVGVITTMARPGRMLRALARLGVAPVVHLERADHAAVTARERVVVERARRAHGVDVWIVDRKTSVLLRDESQVVLEHRVVLPRGVIERLVDACHTALANPGSRC